MAIALIVIVITNHIIWQAGRLNKARRSLTPNAQYFNTQRHTFKRMDHLKVRDRNVRRNCQVEKFTTWKTKKKK